MTLRWICRVQAQRGLGEDSRSFMWLYRVEVLRGAKGTLAPQINTEMTSRWIPGYSRPLDQWPFLPLDSTIAFDYPLVHFARVVLL